MSKQVSCQSWLLVVISVALLLLWAIQAPAQVVPEEPVLTDPGITEPVPEAPAAEDPEAADTTNPPVYIGDLVERTELTQVQVEQMRSEGAGWGNIRIAALLAEHIAAQSVDSDTPLTFDEALEVVLAARAEGRGFGEIANDNEVKIGQLTRRRNRAQNSAVDDTEAEEPKAEEPKAEEPKPEEPEAEEPAAETSNATNPPAYIGDLVEKTELTEAQVDQMRSDGAGWGNIRIAALLAEHIAAESADSDTPLTFDEALEAVLAARAEGLGFGEIANDNEVKIGRLMQNRNRVREPLLGDGLEAEEGVQAGKANQTRGRKRGLFARIAGVFGGGKSERADKAERQVQLAASTREKPNKLQKAERPERVERPERPAKPEKPERPERPAKPEKPEKPERGPRR